MVNGPSWTSLSPSRRVARTDAGARGGVAVACLKGIPWERKRSIPSVDNSAMDSAPRREGVARSSPATDQSVASFSSHIRKQFHKVGISDSGDHRRQRVAKRSDASNLVRKTDSKGSLPHPFISTSPRIEPTTKERPGLTLEQILKRG